MFNFKKIASVLSSAVMISSTVALAAAANFPAPYVTGGASDVAVVYGANAATTDLLASVDIQSALSTQLASQTASGGSGSSASTSGETAPLFTSGTRLYVNDSLNLVKTVLTDAHLPNALVDGSFSGNVDVTFTQTIDIGSKPILEFKKQPTSDDEPAYGYSLSTAANDYIYNATVVFNKAINFSHADSEGEDIILFGQTFTVAASTSSTDLVLLKSADKIALSSDDPTKEVTISGKTYTLELVSASDSAATVKVTDDTGASETKEISESASKKVNGITIAITTADETNLKLSASIVAGSEKVTMKNNQAITVGEEGTVVDGTKVRFAGTDNTNTTNDVTKLVISIYAPDSEGDALKPGQSFVDPVFGSFKLDFGGLNIADDSTSREEIVVANSGDDRMEVKFTDVRGDEKTIPFALNLTGNQYINLERDNDGRNITVREGEVIRYQDYVVVGNEDEGHLLRLYSVDNATESTNAEINNDYVKFDDVFTGAVIETTWQQDGTGTMSVGGKSYGVTLYGNSANASEDYKVVLNYPDSSGTQAVIWPSIQTKKGALIAFYEPLLVNMTDWNDRMTAMSSSGVTGGKGGAVSNLTGILVPDGDGYTTIALYYNSSGTADAAAGYNQSVNVNGVYTGGGNVTSGGSNGLNQSSAGVTVAGLTINFSTNVRVGEPTYEDKYLIGINYPVGAASGAGINLDAALIIIEEKDDNSGYQSMMVSLEEGGSGDDGIGIEDVTFTWGDDGSTWEATMASDSKITKKGDLYGTIATIDASDSDQKSAKISYPDEQVYANIYIGELASSVSVTGGSSGSVTSLGSVLVTDAEASSVSAKNLIVVGGSCINSVAADLLGGALCSADFEAKTGVGAGSFLIETFSRTGGKVATLVAGYNAGDTTNAAKFLTTQVVDTTVGKKYKGTSATSATLVTEAA